MGRITSPEKPSRACAASLVGPFDKHQILQNFNGQSQSNNWLKIFRLDLVLTTDKLWRWIQFLINIDNDRLMYLNFIRFFGLKFNYWHIICIICRMK